MGWKDDKSSSGIIFHLHNLKYKVEIEVEDIFHKTRNGIIFECVLICATNIEHFILLASVKSTLTVYSLWQRTWKIFLNKKLT